MNHFNYNGKLYPEGSPIIGADNRGLRYGDGLFETIKMKNGKLLFEDEHFARLWKGLKVLEFDIPKHFTVEVLQKEISALAQKNGHEAAARIRLNIIRGDGGLYDAKNHLPAYIIQTWPLAQGNGEWNSNGLVLGIYEAAKKSCDILSNLKHNNYLPYVLAALSAKKEKWNDAVILNTHGRICDTTIANIFIIKDNVLYTPSLQEGCVAGIMRRAVIQNVLEVNGQVVEKEITITDLLAAEEVFLTNSMYHIRWVQRIGDTIYQNTMTQKNIYGYAVNHFIIEMFTIDQMKKVNIIWFRRDLRLNDNAALFHALQSGIPVLPIFIFDKNILDQLEQKADRRVAFIHAALKEMQQKLLKMGSSLEVYYGTPLEIFKSLATKYELVQVFANHDYEPYALEREKVIRLFLESNNTTLVTFKDQVVFEKNEVVKDDATPYTIFTPYSRKWKAKLTDDHLKAFATEKYFKNFYQQSAHLIPTLQSMGFIEVDKPFPSQSLNEELVKKYSDQRNFPAIEGTSKLGVHLRFGTTSIRELARKSIGLSETFLNELIWRDFYHMILFHFPQVGHYKAFKPQYDLIEWRIEEGEFERWCNGQTGYPIVDAGMRELNETGFMHNRVRMIVASFLTKHLLIDWRWGEAYFAQKLLDFDLAANNGGWQWAAGSGCDAAPYFRIFNPYLQTQKFDPKLDYIKKWVPEFQEFSYPAPIVVHEVARKRCLEVYGKALKK